MSEFYDSLKNVRAYIQMCEETGNRLLVDKLREYLAVGSSLLELGMGPGFDLELLKEYFQVTGSDLSQVFLDLYRKNHPEVALLKLDAVNLSTERKFDGIYSNKVLHHLSQEELGRSFRRQWEILNPGGILFHSFWRGDKEEYFEGLRFVYYSTEYWVELLQTRFTALDQQVYTEMEEGDSFYLVLQRKP